MHEVSAGERLDGRVGREEEVVADGAVGLEALLAARVRRERERHARVARHAVEEVDAQALQQSFVQKCKKVGIFGSKFFCWKFEVANLYWGLEGLTFLEGSCGHECALREDMHALRAKQMKRRCQGLMYEKVRNRAIAEPEAYIVKEPVLQAQKKGTATQHALQSVQRQEYSPQNGLALCQGFRFQDIDSVNSELSALNIANNQSE